MGKKWSTLHLPCFTYLICRYLRKSLCFNSQTITFYLFWNSSVAENKNTNPVMECKGIDIYLSETSINLTCFHPTITVPSPCVCNHHQNYKILMLHMYTNKTFVFLYTVYVFTHSINIIRIDQKLTRPVRCQSLFVFMAQPIDRFWSKVENQSEWNSSFFQVLWNKKYMSIW